MLLHILFFFSSLLTVLAYIPAWPSNLSVPVDGTGQPNVSILHLQWYPYGSDWVHLTQQPVSSNPTSDPIQGILLHFTEDDAGDGTTTTPWIALVSCDANSTHASREANIFSTAKDHGAKSVILYSLYSETCLINPNYRGSSLDVFTTQTVNASRRIEYEFGFGSASEAYYGYFNATMLNNAARAVNISIASNSPATSGFLFSTLLYNTSDTPMSGLQADANSTNASANTSNNDSGDTGVAMIILYAITGCVSALFCGVIVSGAIRAIRHPERYGPRRADPTLGGGQSRAGGLGRAILDTFPVVKFGPSENDRESSFSRRKDIESASNTPVPLPDSVRLAQLSNVADLHGEPVAAGGQEVGEDHQASAGTDQVDGPPQINIADHEASHAPSSSRQIVPECIGRETCPICIVDFEEGDDLRVLPCEGKHRFHQSCVDPWLLELSGSCPICRQDFHALETIISGGLEHETSPVNRNSQSMQQGRRFSRYLRFALGRQRGASSSDRGSPALPEF